MSAELFDTPAFESVQRRVRSVVAPRTERDRERRRIAAMLVPFFVIAFFAAFVPLVTMARMSVSASQYQISGFSLSAWETLVSEPIYREVAWNTLWFATATTLASVAISTVVAHSLQKYDLPGESLIVAIVSFPISLPGIVVAFMVIVLLGNTGLLTNAIAYFSGSSAIDLASARSVFGLFVGYLFSLIPRSTMVLRATYAEVNEKAEEAARSLGAGPLRTFYNVTLPQIRPGIVAAIILTFRTALAIFGTVLVLKSLVVVTLRIDQELGVGFHIQLASAIGLIYFVFTLLFTFFGLKYTSANVIEL